MELQRVPIDENQKRKLEALISSDPFNLFRSLIQAEMDSELWDAKLKAAELLFNPDLSVDAMASMRSASKLMVALQVIDDFAQDLENRFVLKITP